MEIPAQLMDARPLAWKNSAGTVPGTAAAATARVALSAETESSQALSSAKMGMIQLSMGKRSSTID